MNVISNVLDLAPMWVTVSLIRTQAGARCADRAPAMPITVGMPPGSGLQQ
jgi:hypothetical protein